MSQDYGPWSLVVVNSALLIAFGVSFFHPRTGRDWRAMGGCSTFIVALMPETYGAPLTVHLPSGWLGSRVPALQATHEGGHLWNDLIGWSGDPHVSLGLLAVMLGWLLQWPTIPTLLVFPVLAYVYAGLAGAEEHEVAALLPQHWTVDAARVHANVPHRPDESGSDRYRGPEAGSHAHR